MIEGEMMPPQQFIEGETIDDAGLVPTDPSGHDVVPAQPRDDVLNGIDLSYANLSHADLRGADLAGAILVHANLSGANLADANLAGADLSGALVSSEQLKSARTYSGAKGVK
jgi:uncharacterized protein YjbI with pentapeptide repeats